MSHTSLLDDLGPNDPIVRYMRLSAFLSLINGQMFVPSLKTLKESSDPTEGLLSSTSDTFPVAFGTFASNRNLESWLFPAEIKSIEDLHRQAAIDQPEAVVDKLTKRIAETRAILCFHAQREENMAMWQIYARDGVVIETTPACLDAVAVPPDSAPHIARIRYHQIRDNLEKDAIPLVARPYIFKLKCYAFEQEVRWTFVKPQEGNGVMLRVNPRQFIKRVRFSPFMHPTEAKIIGDMCRQYLGQIDIGQSGNRKIEDLDRFGVPVPLGSLLLRDSTTQ